MNDNIFNLFCPSQIRFQLHHFIVLLSFLFEETMPYFLYSLCFTIIIFSFRRAHQSITTFAKFTLKFIMSSDNTSFMMNKNSISLPRAQNERFLSTTMGFINIDIKIIPLCNILQRQNHCLKIFLYFAYQIKGLIFFFCINRSCHRSCQRNSKL